MRRDYLKQFLLFLLVVLVLSACSPASTEPYKDNGKASNEDGLASKPMPKDMPEDFGFTVQFGVGKINEINTFKGTVTKDLISDGTATANVSLTDEEMILIYEQMKQNRMTKEKKLIPEPVDGSICMIEPYEEDEWEIILDGETITQSISGEYCDPTKDAKQLLALRDFVFSKIKSKEEYKNLPDAHGGYE
jgi:hypothetical protein